MLTKTRLGKRSLSGLYSGQESSDIITMENTGTGHPSPPRLFSLPSSRPVSSSISVPKRQTPPQEVDMDELMAAMVLSSLSCSPQLRSPAHSHTVSGNDCGGGDLSEDNSEHMGICHGNRSPTPSPLMAEVTSSLATPPEEGMHMDLDQVSSDEPVVRKHRSLGKTAYRCLWPCCGKTLTSVVGIKRHIRTTHLRDAVEHERCEEDFYYTEVNQWEQPLSLPVSCGPAPISPGHSSAPSSPPRAPPPSPPSPASPALSRSAPSSSGLFWQVQSEHSYQAPPPGHVTTTSDQCTMTPPTSCHRQGRTRSISVGEQWLQQQGAPCRRPRGEAKKCRKVYGVEHRDRWCTACRWKKACQRFTD
ncbi:zinc finger protein 395-like [Takifugu flavidus]|uniref:zinc finger protein 395-like n=1 Tax=Takifugu flavidus TaxID=433684 RepID=UPI002544BD03|nr:zinc finger protein 395-like [Takifugu flavidus]XP_056879838.1 zinc finger protein 395-like [Takifugu flavidus]XP_056879847.1 zinc finger protein 395-like [Takifugu flavidus]